MGQPALGQVPRHLPVILAPAVHDPGAAQGFDAAHMGRNESLRVGRDLLGTRDLEVPGRVIGAIATGRGEDVPVGGAGLGRWRHGGDDHAAGDAVAALGGQLDLVHAPVRAVDHKLQPVAIAVAGEVARQHPAADPLAQFVAMDRELGDTTRIIEIVALQRPVHRVDDVLALAQCTQGTFSAVGDMPFARPHFRRQPHLLEPSCAGDQECAVALHGLQRVVIGPEIGVVFGRHDEAELVPIAAAAVEEVPTVGSILSRGIDLAAFAVARNTITFEVAQMCLDRLGADEGPSPGRAPLRVQLHDPRLHGHAPGPHPAPVRAARPRVPALQLGRYFRAPAARVEPSACLSLSGQPVRIAARAAHGLVHFDEEALRFAAHARRPRLLVPGFARADAELGRVTGHGETIGGRVGADQAPSGVIAAWRAKTGRGVGCLPVAASRGRKEH